MPIGPAARSSLILVCAAALPGAVAAQPAVPTPQPAAPAWSWSLSGTQYWIPNEPDFLLGIGTADLDALHLEGRWQYEDHRSASFFAGWTFSAGKDLHLDIT